MCSSDLFAQFTLGTWQPTPADMLPVNEATTIQLVQQNIGNSIVPSNFVVDVLRPDGSPVVTGTISFKSADSTVSSGVQDVVRASSGRWTINISNLSAGSYVGDGVGTSNLAGRTISDLILNKETNLTNLPWVQHKSRKWEIEPFRWIGVNSTLQMAKIADVVEKKFKKETFVTKLLNKLRGH